MIAPSTFLRAAIFRCESAAAPDARAGFSRLLQDARAFEMGESAEAVVARLQLHQVPRDTVCTLVAELMVSARRAGQVLVLARLPASAPEPEPATPSRKKPAPLPPRQDEAGQSRQAFEAVELSFALLLPLFAYLARADGAAGSTPKA
jgi:hypothetical protein